MPEPTPPVLLSEATLRDFIASQVLPATVNDPDFQYMNYTDVARNAYAYADAMMIARDMPPRITK